MRKEIEFVKRKYAHLFTLMDLDFYQYCAFIELRNKEINNIILSYDKRA